MADVELFPVRNNFFIGNYQQCITESQRLRLSSDELALERDIYMYRSYVAQVRILSFKRFVGVCPVSINISFLVVEKIQYCKERN